MQQPAPGQFDFSQQRRTFRLELLRSVPQGLIFTVFATFAIYVAIREFNLSPLMKGAILGSSSVGLLLSLFVVQLIRRLGWSVNRMAASLWSSASLGFIVAAFAGTSGWTYFIGICFSMMALGSGLPLMAQIYRKHYADESRGRLFSRSSLSRSLVAAAAGWGFGMWMEGGGSYRLLFIVYALGCLWMSGCVLAMAPVLLRISNRIQWFDAFRHAGQDRAFRKLLGVWMILGLGNLISSALFVEYIGNPEYGFALPADQSGLITSTIPMVAAMVTVLPWGWIFDRLPFYQVRALVNLFFIAGILFYFLGGGVLWLCVGIALHGIARSGGEILWSLWTMRFAESERVAEYQSVHSFLTGVRGVLAPLIAFTVVGILGPVSVAWISAGLMGFSTLMIGPELLKEWREGRAAVFSKSKNMIRRWRRGMGMRVAGDFVVNEEHRVVYQALPKVACTTWKNVMARLAGIELTRSSDVHCGENGLVRVSRPSRKQLRQWNRDYYLFTFIRNPWTRVLSAYIDKFEGSRHRDADGRQWAEYATKHRIDSFASFVRHLEKTDPFAMNPHWAPQNYLLNRDRLDYDFIGKFEDMQRDGAVVLERLGLHKELEEMTLIPHRTGADELLGEYYSPELIEVVGRIYAEDVRLGDYRPPGEGQLTS